MASESEYTSAHTAASTWAQIKLRMQAAAVATDGTPAPVKTPRKRKNGAGHGSQSPGSAKKSREGKAKKTKDAESGEEDLPLVKDEPVEQATSQIEEQNVTRWS